MGMDINGWVEVRSRYEGMNPRYEIPWYGVITINCLVMRSYDMFSSLFGMRPFAQFTPIAPARGLPPDISEQASDDYLTWNGVQGETWISWQEIKAIDWNEEALDTRPHEYVPNDQGQLIYKSKASADRPGPFFEGDTWQEGETVYRIEKMSRREGLSASWQLLFRLMETLAAGYGDDNVRLVVWFDC